MRCSEVSRVEPAETTIRQETLRIHFESPLSQEIDSSLMTIAEDFHIKYGTPCRNGITTNMQTTPNGY